MAPDAVVAFHHFAYMRHVRAMFASDGGKFVHHGNARGQHGVAGVLGKFGAAAIHHQ